MNSSGGKVDFRSLKMRSGGIKYADFLYDFTRKEIYISIWNFGNKRIF
jgi:hypothetical protein